MSGTGSPSEKSPIELSSDEAWKEQVNAEAAKLDAELKQQSASTKSEVEEDNDVTLDPSQLPPPSLISLLQMLSSQSIVAMGLVPSPTGKSQVNLPLAKHFIDLLSVLEEKCKGNLTTDESRFIDGTLHELRMAYVEMIKKK